jgi:hypothetical protein
VANEAEQAERDAMLWSPVPTTHFPHSINHCMLTSVIVPPHAHRVLRSYKFKLEKDLRDKLGAQDIDTTCAGLTNNRRDLTYSPEAVKIQSK